MLFSFEELKNQKTNKDMYSKPTYESSYTYFVSSPFNRTRNQLANHQTLLGITNKHLLGRQEFC